MVWDPEEGPRTKGRALGNTVGKKQEVLKTAYKVEEVALKTTSTV